MTVVVTGLGLVTPFGLGKETFWDGLMAGRCATGPVRAFSAAPYGVDRGAELPAFEVEAHLRRVDPREIGRTSRLAAVAARLALADAGLDPARLDAVRAGVVMGTTSGEPAEIERLDDAWVAGRPQEIDVHFVDRYPCHVLATNVAAELGFEGPVAMIPTACAAGNYAIAHAFELLRSGRAACVVAGGADTFSRITYAGFARLGAIAPDRCRPFDRRRKGMIPGEGAAVLVLETLAAARARGAAPYAEVAGYGLSCDAHHMTGAHPQGEGAARAMEAALRSAGLAREAIDYVSAHGTGTPTNDQVEVLALRRVFPGRAPPISSIKSMIGHTMGAASAIEAAACCLAVQRRRIPPTIHFEEPDEGCADLDFVPNAARDHEVAAAMNNAYAFGGNNASVIFRRIPA